MASSLNTKRVFLMMIAAFGLIAAIVCIIVLAAGMREPTKERIFLVGSLLIVSIVCLALAFHFKDATNDIDTQIHEKQYQRLQRDEEDPDEVSLPQNNPGNKA